MLTKCTTCQKDIAESARICPHCGGRKPLSPEEQIWHNVTCALIVLLGLGLILFLARI